MKRAGIIVLIVAALAAGGGAYYLRQGGTQVSVNTVPITRGDIIDTVGATGTLQAVTTVQVGSQVSGNISWLGADFNSIVKKGQVIAKLDPSLFDAQVAQSRANVNQARANLAKAQSDLDRMKVELLDAQQKYGRTKELSAKGLMPQSDLDAAKIAVDSAQASLESQEATVKQTQASIAQAQASQNQNQVNLDHTIITAPIDGIVTQRSVDVGQTVAASMQAPTLFVIAADLTKMQVNANIDEADVGRMRPGQHVTFKVDAYPTDTFQGEVTQIRLQPVVQSNVTTYGTIVNVPNADLKLKPGMTANLKIEVAKRNDVLRVPNTALRFRPTQEVFLALNQPIPPEVQFGGRAGRAAGAGAGAGVAGRAEAAFGANGGNGANLQTTPAQSARAAAPTAAPSPATPSGEPAAPRGGRGGDPAQRMERFKAMTADEQQQFIARMKGRGVDTSAFEAAIAKPAARGAGATSRGQASGRATGALPAGAGADTIDALFPALQTVETRGRLWLYADKQIKPVNVRLGITDGSNTELVAGDLQQNAEVVTGVTGVGTTVRAQPGAAATGNPFQQNRGFGGGGRGR